jgi:3-oxoisoapionate decarboxylase
MKLGISSYTFGWAVGVEGYEPRVPMDEHALIAQAKEFGVGVVQIGDNLPLATFAPERLEFLAAKARQEKIQLEVGARRLTTLRVKEYAEIARKVGARLVRFLIDDENFQPTPGEVIKTLWECSGLLDGLVLGIENHDRFSAQTLARIVEEAADERIGICLDTANSLGAGEGIEHVAKTLAGLTVNLHIKDFWIERLPHKMGFTVTGRAAGEGMLRAPWLVDLLRKSGRCETATLELWTPQENDIEATVAKELVWAERSVRYLKSILTSGNTARKP